MDELKRLDEMLARKYPRIYRSVGYEKSTTNLEREIAWFLCYVEGFPYGRGETPEEAMADMEKDGRGPR